jgi:acyl-CoA synthetase (NDP forming)
MDPLLNPRSVCLIGASGDTTKLAGRTLLRLRQHDFPGDIYLVNPKYSTIDGNPCYPSVGDIGKPIDVALISLPAALVPGAIRDCGAVGIPFAVVISSGFGEDASGDELSDELADAVRESGVRLVGPNCEGIWSTPAHMALTFGSAADRPVLLAGPVSVISQSGSIGGAAISRLQELGVGCRYFISSGNESDLTSMDYLEYLVDEGNSSVIAMFIEGIRGGERLQAIARRAAERGIRLIALCSGASESGRLATSSHTGRIASAASVYRDLLAQAGVVQVDSLSDFIASIELASLGRLPVESTGADAGGLSVVASSGGSRALLADASERLGVRMATYSPQTVATLERLLPRFAYAPNPTDLTGQALGDQAIFSQSLDTVINDPNTEILVVQYANAAGRQLERQLEFYGEFMKSHSKPVILSLLGPIGPDLLTALREAEIVCVYDPSDAVKYAKWLNRWNEGFADVAPQLPGRLDPMPGRTWAERMALLEQAGIPVPKWRVWHGAPEDLAGFEYPLVMKALPEHAEHKTEAGLVFVGLTSPQELDDAAGVFRSRVPAGTPSLIQEMAPSGIEMLLTAREDPDFGPILAIGAGGVRTEWMKDIGYVPLPATRNQIRSALERLAIWDLLQSFRGGPVSDVEALLNAAESLGELYLTRMPRGSEIELNPVIVGPVGSGVFAVDALCAESSLTVNH